MIPFLRTNIGILTPRIPGPLDLFVLYCDNSECDKAGAEGEYEEKYDCQEDGVNYLHRKFPNHPDIKTDTWQECQKKCAATEHCKFFTWHKRSNRFKNDCALSQTYGWKKKDSTVSGPRECPKRKSKSDQISKLWGVSKE